MWEKGWQLHSGGFASPATRDDFLTAVSNLDAIMVRATVSRNQNDAVYRLKYEHKIFFSSSALNTFKYF